MVSKKEINPAYDEGKYVALRFRHDFDYEHTLLGAWMSDEAGKIYFTAPLPSKEFYLFDHWNIAQAIEALVGKGSVISPLTVNSWLKDMHHLEDAVGEKPISMYVEELIEYAPTDLDNALFYRDELHEMYEQRTCQNMGRDLYETGNKPGMLDTMIGMVSEWLVHTGTGESISVESIVTHMMTTEKKVKRRMVRTGLYGLDELLYGLHPSSMYTVIARMSVGKTSFLSWIALQSASAGIPFAYVTAEMSPESLTQRMLATLSGVNLTDIMQHLQGVPMSDGDLEKFYPAVQRLANMPIYFIPVRSGQIDDVALALRKEKVAHKIEIAGMDYLQLFHDGHTDNQTQELDNVSHKTKGICLELDIPLIAVVTANRGNVKEGRNVEVSDVRGSDSIGYDTDVMISLNDTDERMDAGGMVLDDVKRIKMKVVKNRNGRTGEMIAYFDGKTQRWSDAPKE